jgi:hypothetical protein
MLIADQIMNNSIDFDLQEIIENRPNSQENVGENGKDELMETQTYEDRSFSDSHLNDSVKQLGDL